MKAGNTLSWFLEYLMMMCSNSGHRLVIMYNGLKKIEKRHPWPTVKALTLHVYY
jgi:hypothetical protein